MCLFPSHNTIVSHLSYILFVLFYLKNYCTGVGITYSRDGKSLMPARGVRCQVEEASRFEVKRGKSVLS